MEIMPRLTAMASRARAAFPARCREVTCSMLSRPDAGWQVLYLAHGDGGVTGR
jgi:hypothetical protein